MRKRVVLAGVLAALYATPALAADPEPYLGGSAGAAFFHDNDIGVTEPGVLAKSTARYQTGYALAVCGGFLFDFFRLEGEFGYTHANVDNISGPAGSIQISGADATVMSYMGNAYYDFRNSTRLTPFVGAGIGLLHGTLSEPGTDYTSNVFGYQGMAGLSIGATSRVDLDLYYRYQGSASDFSNKGISFSYQSSTVLAGLRYNF